MQAGAAAGREPRMYEDDDDGFEFGPDESDAPTWREIWDLNKRYVYGSLAGMAIGLAICLALNALELI